MSELAMTVVQMDLLSLGHNQINISGMDRSDVCVSELILNLTSLMLLGLNAINMFSAKPFQNCKGGHSGNKS